jgi:hypothetical protein
MSVGVTAKFSPILPPLPSSDEVYTFTNYQTLQALEGKSPRESIAG